MKNKWTCKIVGFKKKIKKLVYKTAALAMGLMMFVPKVALAAPNPGESAKTWILDQAFPLALAITIMIAVMFVLRKNVIKVISTLLLGGFLCAIIKQPTLIQTSGTWIIEILGLNA